MLLSVVLTYFGFAALSITKNRHYQQIWPQRSPAEKLVRLLQISGWLLLTVASVYLISIQGIGLGLTNLLGLLSLAGLAVVLQFSYAPRTLAGIWLIEAALGKPAPAASAHTSHSSPSQD